VETASFVIGFREIKWLLGGLSLIVSIGIFGLWRFVFQDWHSRLKTLEANMACVMVKQYGHEYLDREAKDIKGKLNDLYNSIEKLRQELHEEIIDVWKNKIT